MEDTFYRVHESLTRIENNFKYMDCNWFDANVPVEVAELAEKLQSQIQKYAAILWQEE